MVAVVLTLYGQSPGPWVTRYGAPYPHRFRVPGLPPGPGGLGCGGHFETVLHQRAGDSFPVQVGPDGARLMVLYPEDAAQQPNLREGQALSVDRGVEPGRESQIK